MKKIVKLNNNIILLSFLLMSFLIVSFSCKKEKKDDTKDPLPDAAFSYTSVRRLPVTVQFINTSTSPTGGSTYVWNFGDGSNSTRLNPTHEYLPSAVYTVLLVQTQSNGDKDSVLRVVTIPPAGNGPSGTSSRPGNISFANFDFEVLVGYTATFTNNSKNTTGYLWNFGDGLNSTSAEAIVTHDYSGTGPFIVKLTATGNGGTDSCKATLNF